MESVQPQIPTILVVFGATGDLMAKKIAGALFSLHLKQGLPERFTIIGVSRRPLTDEDLRDRVAKSINKDKKLQYSARQLTSFLKSISYHQGLYQEDTLYQGLIDRLTSIDMKWGVCANKLFYLAVPPSLYEEILTKLDTSGLTNACSSKEGWTRVIVEKPFGTDLKSAKKLDMLLGSLFREEQIYRIDHYLGKNLLESMMYFRFTNILFSDSWDSSAVESISINLNETLDVENRADFYDGIGALRDVGQNHLLQMLALTTMDNPGEFSGQKIRDKRHEMLSSIKIPTKKMVAAKTSRGQYTGYKKHQGVAKKSNTETYFKIELELTHPKWKGVPIYLEAGKNLDKNKKEITIIFKQKDECLCPPMEKQYTNQITFSLVPKEKISISFWTLKPSLTTELEQRSFEFMLHDGTASENNHIQEYEKLLYNCIIGDQTLFVSTDEVAAMWKIIDPIIKAWNEDVTPLISYTPKSYPHI